MSIYVKDELKAAAERMRMRNYQTELEYGEPYLVGMDDDRELLKDFAVKLLSPGPESITALQAYLDAHTEPLTAEWLRDVWGFTERSHGVLTIAGHTLRYYVQSQQLWLVPPAQWLGIWRVSLLWPR